MAALALDAGILYMRQLLQDQNANFYAATDTEYTRLVNDKYMTWYKNIERRTQRVTAVTTVSTATHLNTSDAGFIYPEIEQALLDYQVGPDSALERVKWNDLWSAIELGVQLGTTTQGTPTRYAAHKLHGSSEKWEFLLYPLCNVAATLKAEVRVYPTALSGANVPELGDAEGYWLYRLAAADLAPIIGRPEMVAEILRPIPESVQGKMVVERKRDDPKRRPETSVLG